MFVVPRLKHEPHQKVWTGVSYVFIALAINKYIVHKHMYTV